MTVRFTYKTAACDRRHYLHEDEVMVLLGRLPTEIWQNLRVVHFNDRGFGVRTLGYVTGSRHEITICALPPRVSLTRSLLKGQSCAEFGALQGMQWPTLAVRRFLLYDVFLHELGHLQLVDARRHSQRLRFAREKLAQQFADAWRRALWSKHFDHLDPVHNAPNPMRPALCR
jgi:hypothetical protein